MSFLIKAACVLGLVLLSAFFSSAETSMTTVSRIRVQALAGQGDKSAARLLRVLDNPHQMLSTILIGNNLVNMACSALTTTLTIELFGNAYVGISTGILTLVVLLFGEITPKTLATTRADAFALRYARVILILMLILTPAVWAVDKLARAVMRLLNADPDERPVLITEREIRTMVNTGGEEGVIENEEKEMINNVFDLGDSYAKDVMIPRIDMVFVDVNATYEELLETFRKCMHTRYPVYENDTDNCIGIINVKDLILFPNGEEFHVRRILREAFLTYEYKNTSQLLVEMRRASVSIAVVLDEYGATAGLVTLEDLLEEIVGEIRDEYDLDEVEEIREVREGKEYIVQGSARLDRINEELSLSLTSTDNGSIGGFIMEKLDRIPRTGDTVQLSDGLAITVEEVRKNRIRYVRIQKQESEQETAPS